MQLKHNKVHSINVQGDFTNTVPITGGFPTSDPTAPVVATTETKQTKNGKLTTITANGNYINTTPIGPIAEQMKTATEDQLEFYNKVAHWNPNEWIAVDDDEGDEDVVVTTKTNGKTTTITANGNYKNTTPIGPIAEQMKTASKGQLDMLKKVSNWNPSEWTSVDELMNLPAVLLVNLNSPTMMMY